MPLDPGLFGPLAAILSVVIVALWREHIASDARERDDKQFWRDRAIEAMDKRDAEQVLTDQAARLAAEALRIAKTPNGS